MLGDMVAVWSAEDFTPIPPVRMDCHVGLKRARRVAAADGLESNVIIHNVCVESGGAPVMETGGATRGYPLEFGGTS